MEDFQSEVIGFTIVAVVCNYADFLWIKNKKKRLSFKIKGIKCLLKKKW